MSLLVSSVSQVVRVVWPVDLPPYIPEFELEEVEYVPPVCSEDEQDEVVFYFSDGEDEWARYDISCDLPSDGDDSDVSLSPVQPQSMSFFMLCFLQIHQNSKANSLHDET